MPIANLPESLYDSLMLYLSQQQLGIWAHFTRAVKEMDIRDQASWLARQMVFLGHLDIDFAGDRAWNITPPTLVRTDERKWYWAGYRSVSLHQKLIKELKGKGEVATSPVPQSPSSVFLRDLDPEIVEQAAHVCGMGLVGPDTSQRILVNLPTIREIQPKQMPITRPYGPVQVFSPDTLNWQEMEAEKLMKWGGTRLLRFGKGFERIVAVMEYSKFYQVDNGLAFYYYLSRASRSLIRYFPGKMQMAVPVGGLLPFLYGRAVILQSGQLPEKHEKWIIYSHVDQPTAELASRVLGQKLEEMNG